MVYNKLGAVAVVGGVVRLLKGRTRCCLGRAYGAVSGSLVRMPSPSAVSGV